MGYFPWIGCENIEFEGRNMKRMKRGKAFVATVANEKDHIAGDAFFCKNLFEHVFAEGGMDLRCADWKLLFGVDVDGGCK